MERSDVLQRYEDVAVQLDVRHPVDDPVGGQHPVDVLAAEESDVDLLALVLVRQLLHLNQL